MHIASRSAAVGDKLITTSFNGSMSHGFAGKDDLNVAVCVLPGTEIAFDDDIKTRTTYWSPEQKIYMHRVGVFRQVDKENQYAHHDALELPDGTIVKLHELEAGQTATVLQLPAAPKTETEAQEQTRLEVVG